MNQNITTVDEYMDTLQPDRQETVKRIRQLCQASLPPYDEVLEGHRVAYKKDNDTKAAFASQEHHIAFFACDPSVQAAYEADFSDAASGMVQFNKAEAVDFGLIQKLLHDIGKANR